MSCVIVPPLPSTERGRPCCLNVDPTGTLWLYCSGNNVVMRGISSASGNRIFTGHGPKRTTACAFSPNGNWIASGDESGKVIIWGSKGDLIVKAEYMLWSGAINDISWDSESKRVLACGDGNELKAKAFLFDTGSSVGEIIGHSKAINSVAYRPVRPFRAASGGEDYLVCFHEGPPFKFSQTMTKHTNFVNSLRFSPDGETLASAGSDSKIHLYEGKTGEYESTFDGISGSVYGVEWSNAGRLGSVSADKCIRIWEKGASAPLNEFKIGDDIKDVPLGISWSAGPLTAVCYDGRLITVDADALTLTTIKGSQGALSSIAYLRSENAYFYVSQAGVLCRLRHGEENPSLQFSLATRIVQVLASDQLIIVTQDANIHFLDGSSDQLEVQTTHALGGNSKCASLGGNLLVVLSTSNKVTALTADGISWTRDLTRSALCLAANSPSSPVALAIAYEGVGTEMTRESAPRIIELLDSNGALLHTIDVHRTDVSCMSFSPDGEFLASCGSFGKVCVSRCDGTKVQLWGNHTTVVNSVSWQDNSNLATACSDKKVIMWNITDNDGSKRIEKINSHNGGATGVVFGEKLASIGADGSLKLWEITAEK